MSPESFFRMRDQSPRSKPAVEHRNWYGGQLNSSHTQFKDVSATFSASNFGAVTTAHDPREIQLGLKLIF